MVRANHRAPLTGMARRYLYMLVEESFRELRSRLLVTQAALAAGYDVVIGQQWWFTVNFPNLPPGVVLYKGNNTIQASSMVAAKNAGHRIASIEEEIFGLRAEDAILPWFDPRVEAVCDLFLMQGTHHADLLARHLPNIREKIKIVGNPRAEVLRLARLAGSTGAATEFVRKNGAFVLINTNYGEVNPFDFDAYAFYLRRIKVGVLDPDNPVEMDLFHTACAWERDNLREMVQFIRAMSDRHPEIPIVLRPHPSENVETWRRNMAAYPSVNLVLDDDHVPWTLACQSMVHSSSTTGLEAFLLGSQVIDICVGESPWHERFIAPIVNAVANSASEAVDIVERQFSTPPSQEFEARQSAALQPFLDTNPTPSSPQRIIQAIDAINPIERGVDLDPRDLVSLESSARQRSKAFVSRDMVRALLREGEAGNEVTTPKVDELGPSVWRIRRANADA